MNFGVVVAPYKCDRCQKSYYTEQKCASHKEQCKGKNTERKFHCEECGRSYVMVTKFPSFLPST